MCTGSGSVFSLHVRLCDRPTASIGNSATTTRNIEHTHTEPYYKLMLWYGDTARSFVTTRRRHDDCQYEPLHWPFDRVPFFGRFEIVCGNKSARKKNVRAAAFAVASIGRYVSACVARYLAYCTHLVLAYRLHPAMYGRRAGAESSAVAHERKYTLKRFALLVCVRLFFVCLPGSYLMHSVFSNESFSVHLCMLHVSACPFAQAQTDISRIAQSIAPNERTQRKKKTSYKLIRIDRPTQRRLRPNRILSMFRSFFRSFQFLHSEGLCRATIKFN